MGEGGGDGEGRYQAWSPQCPITDLVPLQDVSESEDIAVTDGVTYLRQLASNTTTHSHNEHTRPALANHERVRTNRNPCLWSNCGEGKRLIGGSKYTFDRTLSSTPKQAKADVV